MVSLDRDKLGARLTDDWKQRTPSERRSDTCRSESEAGVVLGGRTGLLARLAFAAIRNGRRLGPAEIARQADLEPDVVAAELRQLAGSGEANLDEQGRAVAVAGLSLVPARHELVLAGQPLNTWCAWDAIGIPVALELDARLRTHCRWCQSPIAIELLKGHVVGEPSALLWFPARPVGGSWQGNPQVIWCPQANLFCDREHLKKWQAAEGGPTGEVLTVEEAARRGAVHWAAFRELVVQQRDELTHANRSSPQETTLFQGHLYGGQNDRRDRKPAECCHRY